MSSASRVFRFPVFSSSVICENKISPAPAPFTASLKSRAICQSSSRLVMLSRAFSSLEHLHVVDEDEVDRLGEHEARMSAATFSAGCPVMSRKHGRSGAFATAFVAAREISLACIRLVPDPERVGLRLGCDHALPEELLFVLARADQGAPPVGAESRRRGQRAPEVLPQFEGGSDHPALPVPHACRWPGQAPC